MMNGKSKAILFLGVMYGLGAASGVLWKCRHDHRDFWKSPDFVERRVKKMASRLHLSAEQVQTVRGIIEKSHERARQVNERMTQELSVIHRDSVQSIRQVLTPDQAQEFEKMHQKFHDKHKHIPADDLK